MNHMNNKIDFTVRCKHWPFNETTFRVYYIKHEGEWLPLPPNQCDNADGSEVCDKCICSVVEDALTKTPPFARWPFPDEPHIP